MRPLGFTLSQEHSPPTFRFCCLLRRKDLIWHSSSDTGWLPWRGGSCCIPLYLLPSLPGRCHQFLCSSLCLLGHWLSWSSPTQLLWDIAGRWSTPQAKNTFGVFIFRNAEPLENHPGSGPLPWNGCRTWEEQRKTYFWVDFALKSHISLSKRASQHGSGSE